MSNNLILAFPNRAATAILSGGAWLGSLPLANLQTRLISQVARTNDLALTSTQLVIDQAVDYPVRLIALVNGNMTIDARYRITASNAADFAILVYDSGPQLAWPLIFTDDNVEYEDEGPWWTGRPNASDLAGLPFNLIHLLPALKNARYWKLELDDGMNPAGYLQAGYLFLAPGWQLGVNMAFGNAVRWVDPSNVTRSRGGAVWIDQRPKYRTMRFITPLLKHDEGFQRALESTRRLGVAEPLFVIPDPGDVTNMVYRAFVARLANLGELTNAFHRRQGMPFELEELIA